VAFDLEVEYLEGLKLMAFWHQCPVEDILKRIAATNPPDFGLALRWYIFDFFVGRKYRHNVHPKMPNRRVRYWHDRFNNAPTPTRHYVKLPP
jgi:hypothetical protein